MAFGARYYNSTFDEINSPIDFQNLDKYKKPSNFNSKFSLLSNQVVQEVGDVEGNRFNVDADMGYYKRKSEGRERKVDFSFRYNDAESTMFSVANAYYSTKTIGDIGITYGRKVVEWSPADAYWGFGFINNRKNFDYFEPGQEGLTGVTLKRNFNLVVGKLKVETFISPFYVPELNPGMNIDNEKGTITASNPWSKPPAESVDLNGERIPIKYYVEMPEVSEIVARPSAGASVSYEYGIVELQAFAMKKPENKLTTAVEVVYENDSEAVYAKITPQVFYHNVVGGNIFLRNSNYTAYFGAIASRPDELPDGDSVVTDWTKIETQKLNEDYFVAGFMRKNDRYSVGLHYAARVSAYDIASDSLAQNPRWSQVIGFNLQARVSRNFLTKFDVKYDSLTSDRLMMVSANYRMSDNSFISAGLNMIGAEEGEDTFWDEFVDNDSIYTKLMYRF